MEAIIESDLYLRYILGEVSPEHLPRMRERHIRCNPATAQFIVDPAFESIACPGVFAKEQLDPAYVAEQEERALAGTVAQTLAELRAERSEVGLLAVTPVRE